MDKGLFKALKKVYYKKSYRKDEHGYQQRIDNGDVFDVDTGTNIYSYQGLSDTEIALIEQSGYPVNNRVKLSHDEAVLAYKKLLLEHNLSLENLLAAYLCGFSSFPRGRQPILSYLFAKALPEHSMATANDICPVCSIKRVNWIEQGQKIFSCYAGSVWNERWAHNLIELQEFCMLSPCKPNAEDVAIFSALIEAIRQAPLDETPGKLEQRVKKAKIIPNFNKYSFRGQLMVLAELGIMPNSYVEPLYEAFTPFEEICNIKYPGSIRSDIILPLAGWRGENPIDEQRLKQLFGGFLE
ncbi:hypothetical protein Q4Q49_02565 [Shewanella sp. SP1S1-7]|uniref:hypothetical protein n=1 Tax=Shewanella sp. SP1S1-7 TaxID=3063536 RepID=UPI00288F3354|nr:hypothetical protein [Shewanella sp. SP1S1-7]MDT3334166.1 hypothetical protein [Shewanella sp. SP1S1-7]